MTKLRKGSLVLALLVYLGMLVFPFAASTLLAPAAGVAFLMVGWLAGFAALVLMLRRGSWWTLIMPVVALAFWVATVAAGERFFGWTA